MSSMDEVATAHELFEKGAITEAEFEQVKSGVLSAPRAGRGVSPRAGVPVEGIAFGRHWTLEPESSAEPAIDAAFKAVLMPLAVAAGVLAAVGVLQAMMGTIEPTRVLASVAVAVLDAAPAIAFGACFFGLVARSATTSSKRTAAIYAGGAVIAAAVCSAAALPLSNSLHGIASGSPSVVSALSSAVWAVTPLLIICGVCGSWMRRGLSAGNHPLDLSRTVLLSAGVTYGLAGWLLTPTSLSLGFMLPRVPQAAGVVGSGAALALACLVAGRVRFSRSALG